MFDAIKSFVNELASGDRSSGQLDDQDFRVATAALLIHAASVDGRMSNAERAQLKALLKQRFDIDDAASGELIAQATVADEQAIDLYHFTRKLSGSLDDSGRCRMIEMMWTVAYADGAITAYEDNLVWRVADLLGVSQTERIALRERVAAARGGGEP